MNGGTRRGGGGGEGESLVTLWRTKKRGGNPGLERRRTLVLVLVLFATIDNQSPELLLAGRIDVGNNAWDIRTEGERGVRGSHYCVERSKERGMRN